MPRSPLRATYDEDDPGVVVDARQAEELRRLAYLFLVSAVTLALVVIRAVAEGLAVGFLPQPLVVVWGLAMLLGWAATFAYGVFVTLKARRWGWLALCAIPFTCVPGAVAYAWIRRQEIEQEVLSGGRRSPRD
jgi:hypothetical protein